jgi:hypothetical protein
LPVDVYTDAEGFAGLASGLESAYTCDEDGFFSWLHDQEDAGWPDPPAGFMAYFSWTHSPYQFYGDELGDLFRGDMRWPIYHPPTDTFAPTGGSWPLTAWALIDVLTSYVEGHHQYDRDILLAYLQIYNDDPTVGCSVLNTATGEPYRQRFRLDDNYAAFDDCTDQIPGQCVDYLVPS